MAGAYISFSSLYSNITADGRSQQHNGNIYNFHGPPNLQSRGSYARSGKRQQSDESNHLEDKSAAEGLWKAAFEGQLPRVRRFLKNGDEDDFLDYEDEDEVSVMHHAALGGHADVVEHLLEQGADINASSILGTPLCLASLRNHGSVVKLLLEGGANPHMPTRLGTALHCAAYGGSQDCIKLLLKANADPKVAAGVVVPLFEYILHEYRKYEPFFCDKAMDDVLNLYECTPALLAIWKGTNAITTLTILGPRALTFKTQCGLARSPHHLVTLAAHYGSSSASVDEYTCVMAAARRNDTALLVYIVKALRTMNPSCLTREFFNKQDSNGVTALHIAAGHGNADIVRLLRANGAAIDLKDKKGATPAAFAIEGGHMRCSEILTGDIQLSDRNRGLSAVVLTNPWYYLLLIPLVMPILHVALRSRARSQG